METQITVQTELHRLLFAGMLGLCCGVFFDLLRLLRALFPHGNAAVFIEDALFSFLFCFVFQVDAWSFCGGVPRWPQFLGMLAGFCTYLLTIGRITAGIFRQLRQFRETIRRLLLRLFRRICGKPEKFFENP